MPLFGSFGVGGGLVRQFLNVSGVPSVHRKSPSTSDARVLPREMPGCADQIADLGVLGVVLAFASCPPSPDTRSALWARPDRANNR
jgi:hypothetical protein